MQQYRRTNDIIWKQYISSYISLLEAENESSPSAKFEKWVESSQIYFRVESSRIWLEGFDFLKISS